MTTYTKYDCARCRRPRLTSGEQIPPLCPSCALDAIADATDPISFTCPVCGGTSWNPIDAVERYCGRCHAFR